MRREFFAFARTGVYRFHVLPLLAIILSSSILGIARAATPGADTVATVRHAPSVDGRVEGSVRQLAGENVTINGSGVITSALLVPGTPTLVQNGQPNFGGTIVGTGSAQPSGYRIMLNGGATLGNLVTRTDPVTMPTVSPPPSPTGTRDVTLTQAGQSPGNFSTLRNLTLNSNIGPISVPAGTYGTFIANGGTSLVFGVANATQPAVYNLQGLTLNGGATLTLAGPVIITSATSITLNGNAGIQSNPSWLTLNISGGGLTVNGNATLYGSVITPSGQIIVNGNCLIQGSVTCDRLTVNGNGLIKGGGQGANQAPTIATTAAASPNPATATTTALSVVGADDGGESGLTYTWQTTGTPPAAVTFSANGNNSAKNTTATFTKAGTYAFLVTVQDAGGLNVTSAVAVTVNQTVTSVSVAPPNATTSLGGTQQFTASAADQFGTAVNPAPTFTWAVAGGGTINSSGLFTAGFTMSGPFNVTATNNGKTGTAHVSIADASPTVATAASATPNPTTTTQSTLNVLGADDGGEANLTYTWSTSGTPPAPVTFSANGTNAAKTTVANFGAIGSYTFHVTIADAQGMTATSNVSVVVNPAITTIFVSPVNASINLNGTQQFSAVAKDQFAAVLATQPTFTWSTNRGGTINATGLFTGGNTAGGPFNVTATSGGKSGTGSVTIVDAAPTIVTAAAANPSPVLGTTTTLTALGGDDGGETALSYTWDLLGTPPAAVTFSANGSHAAKSAVATFISSGSYNFRVTIADPAGHTVTSTVLVPVNQTLTTIAVSPANATVNLNGNQQFSAAAFDQFGTVLATQPTFTWAVAGGGAINSTGFFTAGAAAGGPFNVSATSNPVTGTASVTVVNAAPSIATVASANPNPVTGTQTALTVLGADDGGEAGLIYTWSVTGAPPAPVTFSANGTNAAKSSTASFTAGGTYSLIATIKDGAGLTVISPVSLVVNQTFTAISVTPVNSTINLSATQQFAAVAIDQFENPLGAQPAFTWATTGGGTINATGLFTAGTIAGGPFNVSATSGGKTGTAHITITSTAPTVATAANATPNPTTGTQTLLSVLGADAGGEGTLTYTWQTTGTPPATVAFSANGTNASKTTTATFTKPGSYDFKVVITNASNQTANSTVTVVVNQTLSIAVSPATATVNLNGTKQFSAVESDQFGPLAVQPQFTWAVTQGGTINTSGLFTAGTVAGGPFNVTAVANGKTGTATVSIVDAIPTVAAVASANPNPVISTSTVLSVLGADDGGEAQLTYSWQTTGTPPAAVVFSANGTHAAKTTTATFSKPGTYAFNATITDAAGQSATSAVSVVVNQTLTSIHVSPANATVNLSGTQAFTAALLDQFGTAINIQPTWTVAGGGIITNQGLFTAGITPGGPFAVTATSGAISGTASVSVVNAAPTIAAVATANPNPVLNATTTTLSVLGSDDGGEAALTYTWQTTGTPPAPVTFSVNGTNGSKSTVATFTQSGNYSFKVTVLDANGLSAVSTIAVAVNQSPVVSAGADQTIRFPVGGTTAGTILTGSATDDGFPNPPGTLTFAWSKVSGPGTVTFGSATTAVTGAKFSAVGTYVLRLSANDSQLVSTSDVTITVTTAIQPPTVSAGTDRIVALPSAVALNGTFKDDSNSAVTTTWSKVSGPSNVTFANGSAPATSATFGSPGIHVLRLTVNNGTFTVSSDVSVTVMPATNQPPVVTVGPAQTIALPSVAALNGAVTDDGLPNPPAAVTTAWTKVSGPGVVTFGNAASPTTNAAFDTAGTYVLRLTGSDSQLTSSADLTVVVSPANTAPIVSAGADQTIRLPISTVTLNGGAVDDGLPNPPGALTYAWSKVAGPGTVTFANPGAAVTTATFSSFGVYTLSLTASDSLLSGSANVTIKVKQANNAPVVTVAPDFQVPFLTDRIRPRQTLDSKIVYHSTTNAFAHIDYYAPADKLMISANYPTGEPFNFEYINSDGTSTPVPNVHGLTSEIDFHSVPETANGVNIGGFTPGDIYTTTGQPGVIARIHAGTFQVDNPWVTINYNRDSYARFIFDNVGTFGGDMIVLEQNGDIWRVNSAGQPTFLVNLPQGFADVDVPNYGVIPIVVPNDPIKYGPVAGKILLSGEDDRGPMTIDTNGVVTLLFGTGDAAPERYLVVVPNQNLYNCANGIVSGTPAAVFANIPGAITDEGFGTLSSDGTKFNPFPADFYGFHGVVGGEVVLTAFAPCGITPVLPTAVPISAQVSDDGFPNPPGKTTLTWSKVSGPGTVTFLSPNALTTSAVLSSGGTYVLRATADDSDLTGSRDITVYANEEPKVSAGQSLTVQLWNVVTLPGAATDDGLPLNSFLQCGWTKVSGPGRVTFGATVSDAANDFSLTNPSGVWSYGYVPASGAYSFTPLTRTITDIESHLPGEIGFDLAHNTSPRVSGNSTPVTIGSEEARNFIPPELLELNSATDNYSTVRWTAPATGTYFVQGRSQSLSGFGEKLNVVLNATTTLYTSTTDNGNNTNIPFQFQHAFIAGDTIDFTCATQGFIPGFSQSNNMGLQVTITNSCVPATTATFSAPGVYELTLGATDGQLDSYDSLKVTVLSANEPPVVNAGSDQAIRLPALAALSGSATDDGLPTGSTLEYTWSLLNVVPSGGAVQFSNPNALNTTANFSAAGVYTLRLSVSDSDQTGFDDLVVTVNSTNAAPKVSAGGDQSIQIGNSVPLQGIADDDGQPNPTLTYLWIQVSGPATATIINPTLLGARALLPAVGSYVFQFSAYDGEFTSTATTTINVTPATGNVPPTLFTFDQPGPVNGIRAGDVYVLQTDMSDDNLPAPHLMTLTYSVVSVPPIGSVSIANPTVVNPTTGFRTFNNAVFSAPGNYIIRRKISDGQYDFSEDIEYKILPALNQPPVVYAGPAQIISLGDPALLTGTASDDGLPNGTLSFQWSLPGAPAGTVFADVHSLTTTVKIPAVGVYFPQLAVSDGSQTTTSTVEILVAVDGNAPPVVIPPADQTITLPVNTVTLTPTVTDDGSPNPPGTLVYQWFMTSGPAAMTFGPISPTTGQVSATFTTPGVYTLRIAADDTKLLGSAVTHVTVLATNIAPTVSASPLTQALPQNVSAQLSATASDDGLPANPGTLSYAWTQVSGPGTASFSAPTALNTSAMFSAQGLYTLSFTANDGALSTSTNVQVLVTAVAQNKAPIVSAGPSSSIRLPINTANLNGSATDDGLPNPPGALTYTWTVVSVKPTGGTATFANSSAASTSATFSQAGLYTLKLTASDSALSGSATTTVRVYDPLTGTAPTVSIDSLQVTNNGPAFPNPDGAELTAPTDVYGSVSAGDWSLAYAPVKDPDNIPSDGFTTFATGSGAVTNAKLGQFDPTLLLNGSYSIVLTSTLSSGESSSAQIGVVCEKNLKVGAAQYAFNDATITLAGLPISLIRGYDSRNKASGDFGFGWQLAINDIRLQKTANLGKAWTQQADFTGFLGSFSLVEGKAHKITITFPDNKVYNFQGQLTPNSQLAGPITAGTYKLVPIPPTLGTLTVVGDNDILVNGIPDEQNPIVPCTLNNFGSGIPFNPTTFQLTTPEGTSYVIDQFDGLKSLTDTNGNTLTITPNGIISSNGKSVVFIRDGQGRITSIEDCAGNTMRYAYDGNGNLVSFTDRTGNVTQFTFDNSHDLLSIIDSRGNTALTNQYDASGRLSTTTDVFGKSVTFSHNISGRQETMVDRLGNPTTYTYDNDGNIVQQLDALGGVTSWTYDQNDNLTSVTDPENHTTSYTYDDLNNVLTKTTPFSPGSNPQNYTTRYTYDSHRNMTSLTIGSGASINQSYDSKGNLLSVTDGNGVSILTQTHDSFGNQTSETDSSGTVTYQRDAVGFVSQVQLGLGINYQFTKDANGNTATMLVNGTTSTFQRDAQGRPLNVDYGNGITANYGYAPGDASNTVDGPTYGHMAHTYDNAGRASTYLKPNGGVESYAYDDEGKVKSVTDALGHVTNFDHDALGRVTSITNPATGAVMGISYDRSGEVMSRTDPVGGVTSFTYAPCSCGSLEVSTLTNPLGKVWTFNGTPTSAAIQDPLHRTTTVLTTTDGVPYEIDNADSTKKTFTYLFPASLQEAEKYPLTITDEGGHVRTMGYDGNTRLTSATDLGGNTFTYQYVTAGISAATDPMTAIVYQFTYDGLNNVKTIKTGDGGTTTFTYGANNRPATIALPNNDVVTLQYDGAQRVISRTTLGGEQASMTYNHGDVITGLQDNTGTTGYFYDAAGRLAGITYPSGASIQYLRDLKGRITQITTMASATAVGNVTVYEYDLADNLKKITDPLNGVTTFTYDDANRMTSRVLPNGVTTSYQYNDRDQVTSVTHTTAAGTVLASKTYTRQGVGQPSMIVREDGSKVTFSYDSALRLTGEAYYDPTNNLQMQIAYEYDAAGNRTRKTDTTGSSTYSYLPGYLLTSVAGVDNENFTFDPNGNVATIARSGYSLTLQHDSRGQVTNISNQATGNSVQYAYDGMGRRTKSVSGGSTRQFLIAPANSGAIGAQQLVTDGAGNVVAGFVYAGQVPIMRFGPGGVQYYLEDGIGTVMAAADTTGSKVGTQDFDSFGNPRSSTGTFANPTDPVGGSFAFQGMWRESATGIYHVHSRDYDPMTGRFLSRDPAAPDYRMPETLHPYIFANSNPALYADPSGMFTLLQLNITISIDNTLQTIQQAGLQAIKTKLKNEIQQFAAQKLQQFALGPIEEYVNQLLSSGPLGNLFGGIQTGRSVGRLLCSFVPFRGSLWIEPGVTADGEPQFDGFSCQVQEATSFRSVFIQRGQYRPDFIIDYTPPTQREQAYIDGDIKLRSSTITNSVKSNPGQFHAITGYARSYGYRISLYVSLFPGDEQVEEDLREIVGEAAAEQGVFVFVLELLGSRGDLSGQ